MEKNKSMYLKKLGRELKAAEKSVNALEKLAEKRQADQNLQVRKDLQDLREKLGAVCEKFEGLRNGDTANWPQGSRPVSAAYKELDNALESVGSEVKPK